jgi:hypothetical protein
MLYLSSPYSFKRAMFAEAAAMHASAIRVEVAPAAIIPGALDTPDFSGLDQYMALAERYHLRVVGVLLTIPPGLADCARPPAADAVDRCATSDLGGYGEIVREIVRHADPVIKDWEVWNEPDTPSFFNGTPQQYAYMLREAYGVIKQIDPTDQVLLGGISSPRGMSWLAQVLSTPGADAIHAFDIANVHERGRLGALAPAIEAWRQFFAQRGFQGPLWVTEHGYPSNPRYQKDRGYEHGEGSQAAYLQASIPTLINAGASEVFVTERDNLTRGFASEGVLGGDVLDPPVPDPLVSRKPAFWVVRALADCYSIGGPGCQPKPAGSIGG